MEEYAELVEWAPQDFDPEAFVTAGSDQSRDIEELRHLADGDSEDVEDDCDLLASLPRPLLEATLALHPMQRASLVALLTGSLANDVASIATLLEESARRASARSGVTVERRGDRGRDLAIYFGTGGPNSRAAPHSATTSIRFARGRTR
jgi:hypothetical protein